MAASSMPINESFLLPMPFDWPDLMTRIKDAANDGPEHEILSRLIAEITLGRDESMTVQPADRWSQELANDAAQLALAWVLALYGLRADLAQVAGTLPFVIKVAMPLAVAVMGAAAVFRLGHPGMRLGLLRALPRVGTTDRRGRRDRAHGPHGHARTQHPACARAHRGRLAHRRHSLAPHLPRRCRGL